MEDDAGGAAAAALDGKAATGAGAAGAGGPKGSAAAAGAGLAPKFAKPPAAAAGAAGTGAGESKFAKPLAAGASAGESKFAKPLAAGAGVAPDGKVVPKSAPKPLLEPVPGTTGAGVGGPKFADPPLLEEPAPNRSEPKAPVLSFFVTWCEVCVEVREQARVRSVGKAGASKHHP